MRFAVVLAAVAGIASLTLGRAAPPAKPRLAVLVVFDQMRGDFLSRWADLYGKDGFKRLTGDGAWFVDCHYPFANTMTGPGHASVASGCSPDVHGIVTNDWYDVKAGEERYCAATERYGQVPPALPSLPPKEKAAEKKRSKPTSGTPDFLLAPTLGDAVKAATGGKGKVVALSLKDRSAVLPAGRRPDAVYWVDKDGRFVTSTYYRDGVHRWVDDLNHSTLGLSWLNGKWTRLRPDVDYRKWSGPDDGPGEDKGASQGVTFPHPFDGGRDRLRSVYHLAVTNSPAGNELLLAAVKRAIDAEKLGQRDEPDFLSVSFSSNDLIGHCWGPDSQEVLDVTLRSDLIVRDLLAHLDAKVGKGNYVLALTADHGICPLPQAARARGLKAGPVNPKMLSGEADEYLEACFPPKDGQEERPAKGWIASSVNNMIYLNRPLLRRRGATVEEAARRLAKFLAIQTGIEAAFTAEELAKPTHDRLTRQVQRSFRAERCGDVMLVMKPYHFLTDKLTGTTHGSPHDYDTHVPLVVYGAGVKPGVRKERVSPEAAAVILAEGLGIAPPAKAEVKVPAGLFGG